jgi:hypothetical protein
LVFIAWIIYEVVDLYFQISDEYPEPKLFTKWIWDLRQKHKNKKAQGKDNANE